MSNKIYLRSFFAQPYKLACDLVGSQGFQIDFVRYIRAFQAEGENAGYHVLQQFCWRRCQEAYNCQCNLSAHRTKSDTEYLQ